MDAPTLGVLRDTALLAWLALLFGVISYQVMRLLQPRSVTSIGRVHAGAYIPADAIIVSAIAILLLGGLQSVTVTPADSPRAPTELTLTGTLAGIVVQLGICVGLLIYLRFFRGLSPADLFGLRRIGLFRALGLGMLMFIPMLILVNGSAYGMQEWMKGFWPDLGGQDVAEAFRSSNDNLAKMMLAISAAVIAPLVEETIFRGFIYGVLKRYTDGIYAALCSSLLFALVHLHVGTLFPLALLALMFCAMYELTGSLLLPMVMHGLFNASSLIVMALFPDLQP
jgi:membrane protease YdiL (CAAX protease family)